MQNLLVTMNTIDIISAFYGVYLHQKSSKILTKVEDNLVFVLCNERNRQRLILLRHLFQIERLSWVDDIFFDFWINWCNLGNVNNCCYCVMAWSQLRLGGKKNLKVVILIEFLQNAAYTSCEKVYFSSFTRFFQQRNSNWSGCSHHCY